MEGQYLGPEESISPEYIGDLEMFFNIKSWVFSFVLKAKHGSSFGLNFFVLYERGLGFLSPNPGRPTLHSTESLFILGGVPVLSLPERKPNPLRDSVIPTELSSPILPALIFFSPT